MNYYSKIFFLGIFSLKILSAGIITQKEALELYKKCEGNKEKKEEAYLDIKKEIDEYIQLIEKEECKKEYENSDAWLLDRLNRLSMKNQTFTYKRPKDGKKISFYKLEGLWIARKKNNSLPCKTVLKVSYYYPPVVWSFSLSPDFTTVAFLLKDRIETYRRNYPSSCPKVFMIENWENKKGIRVASTDDGYAVAYITEESCREGYKQIWYNTLYLIINSTTFAFDLGERQMNSELTTTLSFNKSGTKLGCKTDHYSVIVDLTGPKPNSHYYPNETSQ